MLQSHRLNMRLCIIYKAYYNLALFTLLDYARPESEGYSVGLLAMYIAYTVGTAASLPC